MADEMVKETQVWLNKTYKGKTGFTTFTNEELDGVTGQGTFKRLIQALQIELNEVYGKNITVDGSFGNGTLKALPSQIESGFPHSNKRRLLGEKLFKDHFGAKDTLQVLLMVFLATW